MNENSEVMTFEVWKQGLEKLRDAPHKPMSVEWRLLIEDALIGFSDWREANQGHDPLTEHDTISIIGPCTPEQIAQLKEIVKPAQVFIFSEIVKKYPLDIPSVIP